MAFRGLFVGIDRYAAPQIKWLNCAKRDAVALHALFADTLGDGGQLLVDEAATKAAIEQALTELEKCDPEDIVALAFSGHGSETHQLVTYETDPARLPETSIALKELAERFARIPARRLVCFLDCCFSGGLGAKVLKTDTVPRDLDSTATLIDRLSGQGRLILTASGANEPAWENQKLRHGVMTFCLIEALQGAQGVVEAGRIGIYQLLKHVVSRVITETSKLHKAQNPTFRGQIDGEFFWPVFRKGTHFKTAFPEDSRADATADILSLLSFGFPESILKTWAERIPTLNPLQLEAINSYSVLDGAHLFVSAPTSSGKTMIGELSSVKGALERRRAIFLLPLRALVNDKHHSFQAMYRRMGIRVIRATGEITDDIPDYIRGRFDICLMTYEKFGALALSSPHILEQVGTIVVDEVQMITDENRGANLEFVLTVLRMKRVYGVEPQIIALSAVVGDTFGFERWLGARLLRSLTRPVPLSEGIIVGNGTFRFIAPNGEERSETGYINPRFCKGTSQDYIIPLVQKLVSEGSQVIVFRETKGPTRGCANYLAENLGLPPAKDAIDALPVGDISQSSDALRTCLSGGVAFHTADLEAEERSTIEREFRKENSTIRVIVATTTLAMGVNTPAEAVVIAGLEHPGDPPKAYSIAEYKNMVGRAGRLGFSTQGRSFLIASANDYYLWNRYVLGKPEDLKSWFLDPDTDPMTLILRTIANARHISRKGLLQEEIIGFLHGSFGVFLKAESTPGWTWNASEIDRSLATLATHGLLAKENDRFQLTQLGRFAGEAGVEVQSILRLVDVLSRIPVEQLNDQTLIAATQVTVEVDQVLFPFNRRSTEKEPHEWANVLQTQGVASLVRGCLQNWASDQHSSTVRAKKAVACLYWITETPIADIESALTRFGGALGGASGPVRAAASRTSDLLPTTFRVAELTHPGISFGERLGRLTTRLQTGVPGRCVELAQILGSSLTRGDYLNLLRADLDSPDKLKACDDQKLLSILAGNPVSFERKKDLIREAITAHNRWPKTSSPVPLPMYEV